MPRRHPPRKLRAHARHLCALAMTAGLVFAALVSAKPALAHAEIEVGDGQYRMVVGFRDEPAYLGLPNALFVEVEAFATGGTEPVDGLAETLTARVIKDEHSKSLDLVPMGEGVYEGAFVPTATGDYTFHISGTIGEATVDETISSSPTTFDSVEPLTAVEFPIARPDPAQLATTAAATQAEIATARILGIAGLAAGLLGLVLGALALTRVGRERPDPEASPAVAIEPSGKLIR